MSRRSSHDSIGSSGKNLLAMSGSNGNLLAMGGSKANLFKKLGDSGKQLMMEGDEISPALLQRINMARKTGKLDVQGAGLPLVPVQATDLGEKARIVWFTDNKLTELPSTIALWGQVTQLKVGNNMIEAIPDEIGKMVSLQMLIINDNHISAIPEAILGCKQLAIFDVCNNHITRLPVFLALLNYLSDFQCDNNPLEFPHRKVLGQGKVNILRYLKRFTDARKSRKLTLTACGQTEIPQEIGYIGDRLLELDASDLHKQGGILIPFAMGACSNLRVAKFHPALEILSPPKSISQRGVQMMVLYLARLNASQKDGTLDLSSLGLVDYPPELQDTRQMEPKLLKYVSINDNEISQLSTALGMMHNLMQLHAAGNKIRALPGSIGKLQHLQVLDMSRNFFTEFPSSLCEIPVLEDLRMRKNQIQSISDAIEEMPSLKNLDLGENEIDRIPNHTPQHWYALEMLLLDGNKLAQLPKEIGKLTALKVLDCSSNVIKGLPAEIQGLASLESLNCTNNKLTELPVTIGKLTNLTSIFMKENPALATLPLEFADISRFRCPLVLGEPYVKQLEIDAEHFTSPPAEIVRQGVIPIFEFLNLIRLAKNSKTFIYVHQQLTKPPPAIYGVETLTSLDLSFNLLSTLPEQMQSLVNLSTLILNSNKMTTLATPVLSLTKLTYLSLIGNPLVSLPVGLGNLASLETLDIGMPGPDLKVPPPEVSRKGGASVMTYFRRITAASSTSRLEVARLGLLSLHSEIVDACKGANITRLSLAHNKLRDLSQDIGKCKALKRLMLHDNALSHLPKEISQLTSLSALDLEGNRFEALPDAMTSLRNLTDLNMSRNEISECPVVVCALTLLCEINMDHNHISSLPNRIGRCGKLISMSFASNELTKLPTSMKDLTCITKLNFSNNLLKIVPPEVGLLPQLEYIDLTGNDLESPPKQVIQMGTSAIASFLEKVKVMMESGHVDLSESNLAEIPLDVLSYDAIHTIIVAQNFLKFLSPSIGKLKQLKSLDLSCNQITVLPPEIGSCPNLEELLASHNLFTRLPVEMGKLTKLTVLDLDHEMVTTPPEIVTRKSGKESIRYLMGMMNGPIHSVGEFSGFGLPVIPKEIMDMVSMLVLRLSDNALESPFPPTIAKFTRLEKLSLDRNPKIRDLPKTFRMMTSLNELTLSGNEYKSIPEEVFRLTNLTHLNIADNVLEGVGAVMGNLSNLVTLDVRNNQLWTLPWGAIIKMSNLKALYMQGNPLTYIATGIGQLTNLTVLDLSNTRLSVLPFDIQEITALTELNLNDTPIESPSVSVCAKGLESILAFLQQVKRAKTTTSLELVEFQCDGGRELGIQHYFLASVLQTLNLSSSNIDIISQPVLALSSLTYLNISKNNLKKLPEAMGTSYPFLEKFDGSENLITSLPRMFGGLTSLMDLMLAKNMLETLPPSIAMCTRLTHLDLNDNQVTYLPKEAITLTRLSHLDMQFRFLTDLQNLTVNWNMWGKPPPDVVLQGGMVVPRFYNQLITAAGMLEGRFNTGPQSTLNLSAFGLLHMPSQICEKGFFTHLVTLNLENNNLHELKDEVSKLTALQNVRLKGNPIKRLTPSLGAFPYISLSCDISNIENVPDHWLERGESGVVEYLAKIYTEIEAGCLDLCSVGISRLPKDITDFLAVQELFLVDNYIDRLPAAIGTLTNLKTLQLHQNRLSSLPKEIEHLDALTKLTLGSNVIRILPSELGLLTNLTILGYVPQTFPGLPTEVIDAGFKHILTFLRRIESARGHKKLVQPLPGLKQGDEFEFIDDDQMYTVHVPYNIDLTRREKFISYFPNLDSAVRSRAVSEGFDCLKNNNVGLTLDLSGMRLEKWYLLSASGCALDVAQDNFLKAMEDRTINPKRGKVGEVLPKHTGSTLASSINLMGEQDFHEGQDPRAEILYELDNDGYVRGLPVVHEKEAGEVGFTRLLAGLGTLTRKRNELEEKTKQDEEEDEDDSEDEFGGKKEKKKRVSEITREIDKSATERPLMTCDRPDPFFTFMNDPTFQQCVPIQICVATNLTKLNLDHNKLKTVASGVGMLSNLTHLSICNNEVESISWRIRYLLYLRELHVSNNKITKLPPKIGRCFRLQVINIAFNEVTNLPPTIGRLHNLKVLDCTGNPISCLPHEIGGVDDEDLADDIVGLRSIRSIVLKDCEHLRQLPSKMYRLTTLTELDVEGSNNIITPPPEVMRKGMHAMLEFLHWLYDGENNDSASFSGHGLLNAPLALAELSKQVNENQLRHEVGMASLKHLDISNNFIRELDPFLELMTNLRSLKVDNNRLERLPIYIGMYTRLGFLSLSNNLLKSFVPEVESLFSIRTIIANNNQIETLVDGYAKLSTLRNLELTDNKMRSIPECILKLSELRSLKLDGNIITKVPKTIMGLRALHNFTLCENKLTDLPNEMGELPALTVLDLTNNQIEMLPIGLGKLSRLETLELRGNGCIRPPKGTQQQGPAAVVDYLERVANAEKRKLLDLSSFGLTVFPQDAVTIFNLTELNLTDNIISSIPTEIVQLTRIVCLRLANTGTQKLSSVVGKMTLLETLDLGNNKLERLPPTFHNLVKLVHLDLSCNKFVMVPPELERLTQLEHIDLNDNELSRMPTWMGTFLRATAILLGGNGLTTVPNSIGGMGEMVLANINLSNNGLLKVPSALCGVATIRRASFSGNALNELPAQIGRLHALEELWVDDNKLTRLPASLGTWQALTSLYAHNNKIQGVPRAIIELQALIVLTLSNNDIRDLPWNLPVLSNLEELWLDSNKLSILPKGMEDMPKLRDMTCRDNAFAGNDLVRANLLMEKFRNSEVADILQRRRQEEEGPMYYPDRDEVVPERIMDVDELRAVEIAKLEKELEAAMDGEDMILAEKIQGRLDEMQAEDEQAEADEQEMAGQEDGEEGARAVILTVTIIGCDDLVPHKGSYIDAYVQIQAGQTKHKTKVQRKTVAPIFSETFEFRGPDRAGLGLSIVVFHKNMISADIAVGKCEIAPAKYSFRKTVMETVHLYKEAAGMDDAGTLDLKYHLDSVK